MRNRLIQLLANNRRPYTPIEQRVVLAADGAEATVYLYDAIVGDRMTAEWCGGVCPQDLVPALAAISAPTIHLRVNSPGGDVFAAEAICQAMREHSANIVAHIEGLAASAATLVCCAADEVVATSSSKYMIHNAWTFAMGNAADLRSMADVLDACDQSMIDLYAQRTGADVAQLKQWCAAETWFTAQQAIDAKFVDRLAATNTAKAAARWDLRAYANAPEAQPINGEVQTPAPPTEPSAQPTTLPAYASADHRHRQQQRARASLLTARIE